MATEPSSNTLRYDDSRCIDCGMCSVVCPHGVFVPGDGVGGPGAPRGLHGVRRLPDELPHWSHPGGERNRMRRGHDLGSTEGPERAGHLRLRMMEAAREQRASQQELGGT